MEILRDDRLYATFVEQHAIGHVVQFGGNILEESEPILFLGKDKEWRQAYLLEKTNNTEVPVLLRFKCGDKIKLSLRVRDYNEELVDTKATSEQLVSISAPKDPSEPSLGF